MKVINKGRIFEVLRNYSFIFAVIYTVAIGFAITSQEKIELFSELMPPEFMGLRILSISGFTFLALFILFSLMIGVHLYRILSNEYIRVWSDFIEGPNKDGQRVVLSFSQIEYMGRDLLGRFSISDGGESVILPGKLSVQLEREIKRTIQMARQKSGL